MARRPSPQTVAVVDALAERTTDWSHGYDLCRSLGLKAGTVYPIMTRLADRGLVERERNELNRRLTMVRPTEQARAIVAAVFDDAEQDAA